MTPRKREEQEGIGLQTCCHAFAADVHVAENSKAVRPKLRFIVATSRVQCAFAANRSAALPDEIVPPLPEAPSGAADAGHAGHDRRAAARGVCCAPLLRPARRGEGSTCSTRSSAGTSSRSPSRSTGCCSTPTGAVLADRVTVFRDADRQSVLLQVDQVRISFAWLSWWRGTRLDRQRQHLQRRRAATRSARTRRPTSTRSTPTSPSTGKDIKIENAQARFLNLALSVRGTIHNDGFPAPSPPPTDAPTQTKSRAGDVALGRRRPWTTSARSSRSTCSSSSRPRRAISAAAAPTSRSMAGT